MPLRSVSTDIWSDTWIEGLDPQDKLLFIYLLTNERTNMLGIYELSINKISFETGLTIERVRKAFKGFERVKKAYYTENNYVVLVNFLKHQKFNSNMKKSAISMYHDLPKSMKVEGLDISVNNFGEGFESLCKAFGMVRKEEVEVEYKEEVEGEVEDSEGSSSFLFDSFYAEYPKKKGKANALKAWKRKNLDNSYDEIMEALERFKNSEDWLQDNGQFIPHCSTWVNGERWKDDIDDDDIFDNSSEKWLDFPNEHGEYEKILNPNYKGE